MAKTYTVRSRFGAAEHDYAELAQALAAVRVLAANGTDYDVFTSNADADCDGGVWSWDPGLSEADLQAFEDAGLEPRG